MAGHVEPDALPAVYHLLSHVFVHTTDPARLLLQVCGSFKSTYFEYKAKASVQCCENPWKVQNSALFGRLDRFLERCHDVRELAEVLPRAILCD